MDYYCRQCTDQQMKEFEDAAIDIETFYKNILIQERFMGGNRNRY